MKKIVWVLVIVLTVGTFAVTSFASQSSNDSYGNTTSRSWRILKMRTPRNPILSKEDMEEFKSTIDPSMSKDEIVKKAEAFVNKKVQEGKITEEQGKSFIDKIKNCPEPGKGDYQKLTPEQRKDLIKNKVNKLKEENIISEDEAKDMLDKIEQGDYSFMKEFHKNMRKNRHKPNNGS